MPSTAKSVLAIDLGSNTLRCIAYNCQSGRWGRDFERIVKTADGMYQSAEISDAAVDRIINALNDAHALFDFDAYDVVAVTTAAMRMADNRDAVLRRIEEEGGIRFKLIDAGDEAGYTMLAVRNRLHDLGISGDSFVLIDIGGGSTEVIFYLHGEFITKSFPVGIVTIAQQCTSPDAVREMMQRSLQPVVSYVQEIYESRGRAEIFVATAGTPTTIAAFLQGMTYKTYDPHKINGTSLSLEQCDEALQGLLLLDDIERARYVGVGKETLIVAGVVIVEEFYKLLGFNEAIIVDDGLREGVALDYCLKT